MVAGQGFRRRWTGFRVRDQAIEHLDFDFGQHESRFEVRLGPIDTSFRVGWPHRFALPNILEQAGCATCDPFPVQLGPFR